MHLNTTKLKKLCKTRGLSLGEILRKAGVSRTAYYSLARRESVIPKTLLAVADVLGVQPSAFLEQPDGQLMRIRRLQRVLEKILKQAPNASRENVWHTLLLLEEPPTSRLKRGLLRGRKINIH